MKYALVFTAGVAVGAVGLAMLIVYNELKQEALRG